MPDAKRSGESYSLWTAPHDTWEPSLDGVAVKLAPRPAPDTGAASVSERVKAFETAVEPEVLIRRVY